MSSRRPPRCCVVVLVQLIAWSFVPCALAQGDPEWNRKAESLLVVPSGGGPGAFDITLGWRLEILLATGATANLGTEVALEVNGALVSAITVPASDPGSTAGGGDPSTCPVAACGGSCGNITVNAVSTPLACDGATPPCMCQTPQITSTFATVGLVLGDEITVLLRPAPGALPDADPGDDVARLVFGSWNRRMLAITTTPSPTGPAGTFDVTAQWLVEVDHDLTVPVEIGVEVDLSVNGTPQATTCDPDCIIWDIQDGCSHDCANQPDGDPCGSAILSNIPIPLSCDAEHDSCNTPPFSVVFPGVPLMSKDVITVLLRPAPGALPELPPLNDDDELSLQLPPTVPTVSEWGLVVMSLLLLTAGTTVLGRGWKRAASGRA